MTALTPPSPPRPIRRGEWVEVRCTNLRCKWHIVTFRVVSGDAVFEFEKDNCPNCGKATLEAMRTTEAA